MSRLEKGPAVQRPYGSRSHGVVKTGRGLHAYEVPVTYRQTKGSNKQTPTVVLATGWIGRRDSMRCSAHELTKAGFNTVAFNYSNIGTRQAIDHNVDDLLAVVDALPKESPVSLWGLSMGGLVVARALKRLSRPAESATFVSSAGFTKNGVPLVDGLKGLAAMRTDIKAMARHNPRQAMHIGLTSVIHCLERSPAILGEMLDLMHSYEPDLIHQVKAEADAPYLAFAYALGDNLFLADQVAEGIDGLPFDQVRACGGGHMDSVWRPEVTIDLIADRELQTLELAA